MADNLNLLGISLLDPSIESYLKKDKSFANHKLNWSFLAEPGGKETLEQKIKESDISLVAGETCLKLDKIVKHRSVGSHFFNYIDFISNQKGQLWGHSLFTEVFLEILLSAIKNQDFKGSVIFLGANPLALPTLEVLARFGFEDFVFLELNKSDEKSNYYEKYITGLLKTKISNVDSTAFIRSQKEYSFCFVMNDDYSQQTLEDMSYFHFLSPKSIVFDLSGNSNFLFKEVKALGVNVTDYEDIAVVQRRHIAENILRYASKVS